MMASVDIHIARGRDIENWLDELAQLRITVFREFPYLYDGTTAYEAQYLQTYIDSSTSVAVIATSAGQIVGASTGLSLQDEDSAFQRPFREQGLSVARIFYCAESVLLPAWRGKGLYRQFFSAREDHARQTGGFDAAVFCAVQRPINHPRRPSDYLPLDPIWAHFGYMPMPGTTTQFSWKDLDDEVETPKTMAFYQKEL